MKISRKLLSIVFFILSLTKCAPPPPIPEPIHPIEVEAPTLVKKNIRTNLSHKRLDGTSGDLIMQDSKATITFHEDYQTIEHEIIVVSQGDFSGWSFQIDSSGISKDEIENQCEIKKQNGEGEECTASNEIEEGKINFSYSGNIFSNYQLIIKYKYNKTKTDIDIWYKQEPIVIPLITGATNCDYKYIIPEGYKSLGLKDNLLTKESDRIYKYSGSCLSSYINDNIRFSPEEVWWKADMELSLENQDKFPGEVSFTFPRYYRGGKLNNTYYRILYPENNFYDEENIIEKDTKLKVKIPGANKEKVSVELHTAFINKLNDDLKYISLKLIIQ